MKYNLIAMFDPYTCHIGIDDIYNLFIKLVCWLKANKNCTLGYKKQS